MTVTSGACIRVLAAALCLHAAWSCDSRKTADEPPPAVQREPTGGERESGAKDLASALEAARAVTLPAEAIVIDYSQVDAVFRAANATTYVERLSASVRDAQGARLFWVDLSTSHQADPVAFHAVGSVGGAGEYWPQLYASMRLSERFEIVRIAEEYWTRSAAGWSGPTPRERSLLYEDIAPARSVSRAFTPGPALPPDGEDAVAGRPARRYRVTGDRLRLQNLWIALTNGLPQPAAYPSGVTGYADLWVQDHGLVLRARYHATAPDGRVLEAQLDVGDFDAPVEIAAPGMLALAPYEDRAAMRTRVQLSPRVPRAGEPARGTVRHYRRDGQARRHAHGRARAVSRDRRPHLA